MAFIVLQGERLDLIGNVILKRLVDDVDLSNRCVGVVGCERKMLDIRTAAQQDALWIQLARRFLRGTGLLINELQQVDQVSRGRKHRTTGVAGTKVHRTKEAFQRGIRDDVINVVGCRTLWFWVQDLSVVPVARYRGPRERLLAIGKGTRAQLESASCREIADSNVEHRVMQLHGFVVDAVRIIDPAY